jgi:hypothetical protein
MSGSLGNELNRSEVDKDWKNEVDTDTEMDLDSDLDFPSPLEEKLYALAVESTQVVTDLLYWTDYDNTEIGMIWLMRAPLPFLSPDLCTARNDKSLQCVARK